MRITSVDPFYLKMPQTTAAADGTQDTLLVRIRTDDGIEGWGESDASPLVSLAVYCCPMSHGNIINIRESLLGEQIDSPDDVRRLHARVLRQGLDIQQIHHAYSAADIALWDIVGKKLGRPVYQLLGGQKSWPKLPYASVLFGNTPEETRAFASGLSQRGFQAAKFGWGPLGSKDAQFDEALVCAARQGLGDEPELMVDAGIAWGDNVEIAFERANRFAKYRVTWLEEPLPPEAIKSYAALTRRNPPIPIAGGENASTLRAAEDYLENAGLSFVQIDAGRIGGITPARRVCELARARGTRYVNHTFKSRLSLAAALHVFADVENFRYLEYPAAGSPLAANLVQPILERDASGSVTLSNAPGLGAKVDLRIVEQYSVNVSIHLNNSPIFRNATL